jgi:hypothetical protein
LGVNLGGQTMPVQQIPVDELEIDGLFLYTSRVTLYVYRINGRAEPERWWIKARIKGRADAAANVSFRARTASGHEYTGRGDATEHVEVGKPTELEIRGIGHPSGFDGSIEME